MIARDEIRELANFHSPETCALTFYYQPSTPQDRSHRSESILVKDVLRNAFERPRRTARMGARRLIWSASALGRGTARKWRQSEGHLCLRRAEFLARIRPATAASQNAGHFESAISFEAAGCVNA